MSDSPASLKFIHKTFFSHLTMMPAWHKGVLYVATLLAGVGGFGTVATGISSREVDRSTSEARTEARDGRTAVDSSQTPAEQAKQSPTWTSKLSPQAMKVGISVIVGFIFGWIFRAFIKTMTMLVLIVVGILFALSYFGVINLDMSSVQKTASSTLEWFQEQGGRIKNMIFAHVPSSGSAGLGAFLGFRRKLG